ncbi:MAG: peroxidase-related enzyme [Novosphingobium sp.]|nr:peroxidase-related enzyme [Novosphingobium sp.]
MKSKSDPYSWLPCDNAYEMPDEWLDLLEDVPEKHSMRVLAFYGKESFGRSSAYVGPIFYDPEYGTLTLKERELVALVVSSMNGCVSCVIPHKYNLGKLLDDHGRAERIAINYRTVQLTERERAMVDHAVKLTESPNTSDPGDLRILRDKGLSDQDIYFLVELIATVNWSNRLTSGLGLRVDDEFSEMIAPQ